MREAMEIDIIEKIDAYEREDMIYLKC